MHDIREIVKYVRNFEILLKWADTYRLNAQPAHRMHHINPSISDRSFYGALPQFTQSGPFARPLHSFRFVSLSFDRKF